MRSSFNERNFGMEKKRLRREDKKKLSQGERLDGSRNTTKASGRQGLGEWGESNRQW